MIEAGFNQETIEKAIDTKWAGKTVHFADVIDSTNLWAKTIVKEYVESVEADMKQGLESTGEAGMKQRAECEVKPGHGDLCVAELQTAGRGRLGRKWLAPAGSNVAMSLILRPDFAPQYAPMLTLVMGLSVAQAIQKLEKASNLNVAIKWPNDAVVSGKKICGFLTEMSLDGMNIREVVVGVGINVNLAEVEEEIKEVATSLYLETGKTYNRNEIINLVLQQFELNYEKYIRTLDLTYLIEDYNNLLINKDKQVRGLDPKEPFEGIARGINKQGELLVEREDGEIVAVGAGEVSVRGVYGYV